MLKREVPSKLPVDVRVIGQGEDFTFKVTFHNRSGDELKGMFDAGKTIGEVVVFLIDEWDSEYPVTVEGVRAAEDKRPGLAQIVFDAFNKARMVSSEKN